MNDLIIIFINYQVNNNEDESLRVVDEKCKIKSGIHEKFLVC